MNHKMQNQHKKKKKKKNEKMSPILMKAILSLKLFCDVSFCWLLD